MIQVKLDDRTIEVEPHLTIKKYQQIQKNPRKYEDHTELLSLYLDITPDELKGLPFEQIKFVESMLTQHMANYNNEIVLTFQHDGVTYGFENDWGNLKWGQWVDMEVFSQQDKINDNIHILMALLYRPIIVENGKKYKLEKYDSSNVMERAEKFLELPVVYWYGCSSFFLSISHEYIKIMQNSLELNLWKEKMLKPLRRILPPWLLPKPPQDTILNLLSNSQEKTSQNLTV
jgi:hypothetical protein